MVPEIVLHGALDASGLQVISDFPCGLGFSLKLPYDSEHTSVILDFEDLAAVGVYATPTAPRGIAIVARPSRPAR